MGEVSFILDSTPAPPNQAEDGNNAPLRLCRHEWNGNDSNIRRHAIQKSKIFFGTIPKKS